MRHALVGQLVDRVHFLHRERDRRRVQPDVDVAVPLHERARVPGIRFLVQDARGVRVQDRVGGDGIVRRHADHAARAVGRLRDPPVELSTVSRPAAPRQRRSVFRVGRKAVRGMDAAAGASRDGFTASVRTDPEAGSGAVDVDALTRYVRRRWLPASHSAPSHTDRPAGSAVPAYRASSNRSRAKPRARPCA